MVKVGDSVVVISKSPSGIDMTDLVGKIGVVRAILTGFGLIKVDFKRVSGKIVLSRDVVRVRASHKISKFYA